MSSDLVLRPFSFVGHLAACGVRGKRRHRLQGEMLVGVDVALELPQARHLDLARHMPARNGDDGAAVMQRGLGLVAVGLVWFGILRGRIAIGRVVGGDLHQLGRRRSHRRWRHGPAARHRDFRLRVDLGAFDPGHDLHELFLHLPELLAGILARVRLRPCWQSRSRDAACGLAAPASTRSSSRGKSRADDCREAPAPARALRTSTSSAESDNSRQNMDHTVIIAFGQPNGDPPAPLAASCLKCPCRSTAAGQRLPAIT